MVTLTLTNDQQARITALTTPRKLQDLPGETPQQKDVRVKTEERRVKALETKINLNLKDCDPEDIDGIITDFENEQPSISNAPSTSMPSNTPTSRIVRYTRKNGNEGTRVNMDSYPAMKALFGTKLKPTPDAKAEGKTFKMADSAELTATITDYVVVNKKDSKQFTVLLTTEEYGQIVIANPLTRTGEPTSTLIGKKVKLLIQDTKKGDFFWTSTSKTSMEDRTAENSSIVIMAQIQHQVGIEAFAKEVALVEGNASLPEYAKKIAIDILAKKYIG